MYQPSLKIRSNGIPVVSNEELDIIGERFVADFCPAALQAQQEIDIDRFLTHYLELDLDYQFLSHCGVYLGTTIFQTTNSFPVYIPEEHKAEFIHVKAGTVIIDSTLLKVAQEHRYRFTAGHEGSHSILHPSYYLDNIGNNDLNDNSFIRCRADFSVSRNSSNSRKYCLNDKQRLEQQANRLASAILMPRCGVKFAIARIPMKNEREWIIQSVRKISRTFNTSHESSFYRLKELGFVNSNMPYRAIL